MNQKKLLSLIIMSTMIFNIVTPIVNVSAEPIPISAEPTDVNVNAPLVPAMDSIIKPKISSVTVPSNGTYGKGDNLDFIVTFDKDVTVTGTPQLSLTIGDKIKFAPCVNSTTSSSILFRYTVEEGDNDSDGISVNELSLNEGTIKDVNDISADLTLRAINTTNININTVLPVNLSVPNASLTSATNTQIVETDFQFDKTTGTIIKYTGNATELSIPSIISGASVTTIGREAFKDHKTITSVIIPDSVKNIESSAFRACTALKNVTIGNSVTNIGQSAFLGCALLDSVSIGNSVETISPYAFADCTALNNVTLGNKVALIGISSFRKCNNLISVTIPINVSKINNLAFEQCSNLKKVYFEGNAPTTFGSDVFKGVNPDFIIIYKSKSTGFPIVAYEDKCKIAIKGFVDFQPEIKIQTVEKGTPRDLLNLPTTINVITDDDPNLPVDITWESNPSYNPDSPKDYIFTAKLPSLYILNDGVISPSISISVKMSANLPDAPTAVMATVADGQSVISFTPPTNNGGSEITNYTVKVYANGVEQTDLSKTGKNSPITVTGLTNGTAYTFKVIATNVMGDSAESTESSPVTPLGTATITPITASFNKKASTQVGVSTTMELKGNTLTSIKNGPEELVLNKDYTVTGNVVLINKDYLLKQSVGVISLSFNFSGGNSQTFTIEILPQNCMPSFTKGADIAIDEDSTSQTIENWAKDISAGTNETDDLNFIVSTDNDSLFSQKPAITTSGTLTYTLNNHVNGTATVTVKLHDNGGTENGGIDTSPEQTFKITVNPIISKVSSVTVPSNGTYRKGQNLDFTVNFDKVVTITGTPQITLKIGDSTKFASYISGSGTNSIVFRYTVQVPDIDSDGIEIGALSLNGGSIKDDNNNDAVLILNNVARTTGVKVETRTVAVSPTAVTATVADGQSVIRFTPPTNNGGSEITNYTVKVYAKGVEQTALSKTGKNSPITVTGLTNGTAYTFKVIATNVMGNSAESTESAPVTPLGTATITPITASFNKKASTQAGVSTTMELKGNTLISIKNGTEELVLAKDYIITGNVVTINKNYLAKQAVGTVSLSFNFSGGNSQTFTIEILPQNCMPSFTKGADITIDEDSKSQTIENWAKDISAGTNETDDLNFIVSTDNDILFSQKPAINTNGTLTYTLNNHVNGTATVTVKLHDNGGTENGGIDTSPEQTFRITVNPIISKVSSVTVPSNGTYGKGQNLDFTVNFDKVVTITGTPQIALKIGDSTKFASYISGSGTNSIVFRYTVQVPDIDSDGIDVGALSLNGGAIKGANNNDAVLTLNNVAIVTGVKVETRTVAASPTAVTGTVADGQSVVSFTPPTDNGESEITNYTVKVYVKGEEQASLSKTGKNSPITITGLTNGTAYTFKVIATNVMGNSAESTESAPVTPLGTATITPITASFNKKASTQAGVSTTMELKGTTLISIKNGPEELVLNKDYTVTGNVVVLNKDYLLKQSVGVISLSFNFSGGNSQTFTIEILPQNCMPSFTKGADIAINEDSKSQTIENWAKDISAGINETDDLNFIVSTDNDSLFSQKPAINTNGTLTYTLNNHVNGTATVTVKLHDNGGTENGGIDTSPEQTFKITVNPIISKVFSVTVPSNGTYGKGQNLDFTVNFDKVVTITGTPQIALNISDKTTFASYVSGSGTASIVFRYTVKVPDIDSDGIEIGALSLNGGTIKGDNNNDAVLILNNVARTTGVKIETRTVAVSPTAVTATVADGKSVINFTPPTDNGGSEITNYTVKVYAKGVEQTDLSKTGKNSPITITGLTNGTEYTFKVIATNGMGASAESTESAPVTPLGTATITPITVSFNKKASTQAGVSTTMELKGNTLTSIKNGTEELVVNKDYTVTGNIVLINKDYLLKQSVGVISLSFNFSGGNSQTFTIEILPQNCMPSFTKGADITIDEDSKSQTIENWAKDISAGTNETDDLNFIVSTDNDSLFSQKPAITTSGTLTYTLNNHVNGTATVTVKLHDNGGTENGGIDTSPEQTFKITVNLIISKVSSVTVPSNGTYRKGQNLDFVVNFDKVVTITGTPQIALNIGDSTKFASYISGSGTNSIVFRYTVQVPDIDNDGIEVGTLSLNGGSIKGANNNNAVLTLNNVARTTGVKVETRTVAASPTAVTATVADGQSVISFTPPTDNGGSEITNYTVKVYAKGVEQTDLSKTGKNSPITITGLTNGTAYTFKVIATNVMGNSAASTESAPVTPLGTAAISPILASFDKKYSAQTDVIITMELKGNTLTSIKNGTKVLLLTKDYTVTGNVVSINKSYLSSQNVGTLSLNFNFSTGNAQTLTIKVGDTTPSIPVVDVDQEEYVKPDVKPDVKPLPKPELPKEIFIAKVTDGKNDTVVSEITVERFIESDGTKKDTVYYSEKKAKETIEKLKAKGKDTVRIATSDEKNEVSETKIDIPKATVNIIKEANVNLDLSTEIVQIKVSKESMQDLLTKSNEDAFFRIVPIKDDKQKTEIIDSAQNDELIKRALRYLNVSLMGRSMKIETNISSVPVDIVLPLTDIKVPTDLKEREAFLKTLVVFIEHSDGEKKLITGEIVEYKPDVLGIKFTINKFGRFTIMKLEPSKPQPQKLLSACEILEVIAPQNLKINKTDITSEVKNIVDKVKFDLKISEKANWKLYSDKECTKELKDKVLSLTDGKNKAYIKVIAEDSTSNQLYSVNITREEKLIIKKTDITSNNIAKSLSIIFIPSTSNYIDAYAAELLAGKIAGKKVLIGPKQNQASTIIKYVTTKLTTKDNIYILGMSSTVKNAVEKALSAKGYKNIIKIEGKDKYETVKKVSEKIKPKKGTTVLLVNADKKPKDWTNIKNVSIKKGYPILFVKKDSLTKSTVEALKNINPYNVYIVGDKTEISGNVVIELQKNIKIDSKKLVRIKNDKDINK